MKKWKYLGIVAFGILCLGGIAWGQGQTAGPADGGSPNTTTVQYETDSIEEKQISFDDGFISGSEYRINLHKTQTPKSEHSTAALAAEILQKKSDQTYYLFLEKTAEPKSCLSISIYTLSGDRLQRIEEQSKVFSPYYLEHIITFDDFNCDGYADMAVIVYEGAMNALYQLYVWSPNEEQFLKVACDEPLYAPEVRDGMVVEVVY